MLASDVAVDDSKGMCKFLAQAAITCLDQPHPKSVHVGALPSVARLLDMYRHNAFEDDQPPGILAAAVADDIATPPRTTTGAGRPWFEDIREAMDKARVSAFGQSSKKAAVVRELQKMISTVSHGDQRSLPAQKKRQAKKFFVTFSTQLQAA